MKALVGCHVAAVFTIARMAHPQLSVDALLLLLLKNATLHYRHLSHLSQHYLFLPDKAGA
jgi:hypothetical protein